MGKTPRDARERHLNTISTTEGVSLTDLIAQPLETEWLWLLNAGSMDARIRSEGFWKENLPKSPTQVVELLNRPYVLVQYGTPEEAVSAMEEQPTDLMLAYAAPSVVERILSALGPSHPTPQSWIDNPALLEFPNGLLLMNEFLTVEEEKELIREYHLAISAQGGPSLKRGALHFGPHFDYTTFATSTTSSTPPPKYLTRLLERLPLQGERDIPDQFTVQYYPPGTGIPPHVDTHSAFEESLYSLSFGASTFMQIRRCGEREARRMRLPKRSLGETDTTPAPPPTETNVEENIEEWELELPPRSLLIMRGPSRFGYAHGIKGRKYDQRGTRIVPREDRYSLTMRRIKPADEVGCECAFPDVCDWRIRQEREAAINTV